MSQWNNSNTLFETVCDTENGSHFCLAKGQISHIELWVIFTKGSRLLMSCNLAGEKWPNLLCQKSCLIMQVWAKDDLFELGTICFVLTRWFSKWYRLEFSLESPIILILVRSLQNTFDWKKENPRELSFVILET